MLFTDTTFISLNDLANLDPDVSNVASVENIPTTGSETFIEQAIEEAAATLEANFQNFDYNYLAGFQTNIGLYSSLLPFGDNTPRPRLRLGQVVVESATTNYASPLKKWVMFLALRNFYQIASNRMVGADKYQAKMDAIQKDIDIKYWAALKASGLPIVYSPVACPGAVGEIGVGTWTTDNVTEVPGGTGTAKEYDVAITYSTANAESGPSARVNTFLDEDNFLHIDIGSLVPNPVPAQSNTSPVVSWNIYVGVAGRTLYFQATVPIEITSYTFSDVAVLSGRTVGTGQVRDTNLTFINAFFRG